MNQLELNPGDFFKPLAKKDLEEYQEIRDQNRTIDMIKKVRKTLKNL